VQRIAPDVVNHIRRNARWLLRPTQGRASTIAGSGTAGVSPACGRGRPRSQRVGCNKPVLSLSKGAVVGRALPGHFDKLRTGMVGRAHPAGAGWSGFNQTASTIAGSWIAGVSPACGRGRPRSQLVGIYATTAYKGVNKRSALRRMIPRG